MTPYHNPSVIAEQTNTEQLKEQIRSFLISELSTWSIDPDRVFLNSINNPEERLVIASASLSEEAWHRVYEKNAPFYSAETAGLFTVPYSFADEHRLPSPSLVRIGMVIGELIYNQG